MVRSPGLRPSGPSPILFRRAARRRSGPYPPAPRPRPTASPAPDRRRAGTLQTFVGNDNSTCLRKNASGFSTYVAGLNTAMKGTQSACAQHPGNDLVHKPTCPHCLMIAAPRGTTSRQGGKGRTQDGQARKSEPRAAAGQSESLSRVLVEPHSSSINNAKRMNRLIL